MIRLEKKGKRIEIRSSAPIPGMRSAIPGAYQTTAGHWTVPLSLESCVLLRDKFGKANVEAGKELKRWIRGVVDNRRQMSTLAASSDAELQLVPMLAPRLAKAMGDRTYQRVGARFIADNHATGVFDDPGLGKTLEIMGGLLESETPGPYLVVAPKTAADSVWRREILRWLPKPHRAVILPEDQPGRDKLIRLTKYDERTWFIVHPEVMLVQAHWQCHECGHRTVEGSKQQRELDCGHIRDGKKTATITTPNFPRLFEVEWGAVIADEAHEYLIRRKGVPTQRRRGMDMVKLRNDGMKLAASGTPFESKPHQLWGVLNWLDPEMYPAFYRWAELYWEKGGHNGHQIGAFRQDREKLLWDSLSSVALRRTKGEVAKDLPPKMYIGSPLEPRDPSSPVGIWIPMEAKQQKAYRDLEETSVAQLKSGRLQPTVAIEELTRLKQLACAYGDITLTSKNGVDKFKYRPAFPSNKFNWVIEALEEWGYPHDPLTKVVIVSMYTGILEMFQAGIEQHFKTRNSKPMCSAITGRTPMNRRRAIIDQFNQRDRHTPHVMLLNVKAGGTAITLDSADRMIFISETRIPDQQKQAEDRIHRVSNPRQCMYYYLRSLGTVDVATALMNQEMDKESHRLLDGRRGLDYFRHVLELCDAI